MKITQAKLRQLITEELANLRESRDGELKSYRGIMSDEVPSMDGGAEEQMSNQQRVAEAIDSIELALEYSLKSDAFGFGRGGPVTVSLKHAKDLLEELASGM
jgi:hypothetical protein